MQRLMASEVEGLDPPGDSYRQVHRCRAHSHRVMNEQTAAPLSRLLDVFMLLPVQYDVTIQGKPLPWPLRR
jgi:hypothetical protein